jgi:hypothetical protein
MADRTSATSGNWRADDADTWGLGLNNYPAAGDNVTISGSHTVTLTQDESCGKLILNGTIAGGGNKLTCINTSGRLFDHSGTIHSGSTLDVELQGTHNTTEDFMGTGNINHLILNGSGLNVDIGRDTTLGKLTITQGTLNTNATHNHDLTVTGDCIVDGTLTGNASAISLGSLAVGGTYSATSGTTIITSERSNGRAIDIVGTYTHNNGTLEIQTPADTDLRCPSSSSLNNLTINHASCIARPTGDNKPPIAGNLTITAGTFNTLDSDGSNVHDLTVTGVTTIGPASGAADQATLTCNSSDISLGALRQQADYAVNIEVGGTFVGGTGTHTFGSLFMAQSANAKATMTTGQVKVNGENTSANKAWRVEYGGDTFDNANGTVMFQFNGFDSRMSMRSESHANNAFHNLIIHMNGDTRTVGIDNGSKLIVDNDLTITRGILQMNTNHELEVVGDVVIDDGSDVAKLQMGNVSTASTHPATFGSLTIGNDGTYFATSGTTTVDQGSTYVLRNLGTYTPNSGTLKVDRSSASGTRFLELGSAAIHKLVIDNTATTAAVAYVGVVNCADDLEVTNGDFRAYGGSGDVTIDGDVTVSNSSHFRTETSQLAAGGVNASFGSLTIASGATYDATPLTTTLTSGGANGDAATSLYGEGTFTHNNGTLHFASGAQYRIPVGGTFYNVTTDVLLYGYTTTLLPQPTMPDGTTAADSISIEGTFRINNNAVNPYAISKLFVHNLIIGDGTGSANSAKLSLAETDVFDGTMYVDNVTINSDGQFLFGDGDETSSTEGSSALNIYGSFRNLGGSVDIT